MLEFSGMIQILSFSKINLAKNCVVRILYRSSRCKSRSNVVVVIRFLGLKITISVLGNIQIGHIVLGNNYIRKFV